MHPQSSRAVACGPVVISPQGTELSLNSASPATDTFLSAPRMEGQKRSRQMARLCFSAAMVCMDVVLIVISALIASSILSGSPWSERLTSLTTIFAIEYLPVAVYSGAYSLGAFARPLKSIHRTIIAVCIAALAMLVLAAASKTTANYSRLEFSLFIANAMMLLSFVRLPAARLVRATAEHTEKVTLVLDDAQIGTVSPHVNHLNISHLQPRFDQPAFLHAFAAMVEGHERVILASTDSQRRAAWIRICKITGTSAEVIAPDLGAFALSIGRWNEQPTIIVSRGPLKLRERIAKRAFDIAGSCFLLLLFSPILMLVSIAIKLDSSGPVLFIQTRVGLNNRQFKLLKFRSMKQELEDEDGIRSIAREDERITPVGKLIRKYSLDELPQLINVLNGSMSLVGPRPHALGSKAGERLFWEVDPAYWGRHTAKPGITGLAQVRGLRGATDSEDELVSRLQSDLEYIECWSMWLDMLILLRTFGVITHHKAY